MNKKILVISNLYPSKNYPERGTFVQEFVLGLKDLDWKITKVVLNKKNGKLNKILSYITFLFRTWISLNTNKDDITYIHYASHSTIPLMISRKQKFLVINVHGSDVLPKNNKQKFFVNIFTKYSLKHANLIVVPSVFFKKIILEKYNVSSSSIFVSPSGGVEEYFYQKRNTNLEKKTHTIGYVSRIESQKGWKVFLESIKKIDKDNVHCFFYGSGSQEEQLKKEIKKLNNPNIKYMGYVEHNKLASIYRSLDWLIFPSYSESLGLVGIEAMATGTPIIASDIGGIKTYAIHNVNSLLFTTGDSQQLSNYISFVTNMKSSIWNEFSKQAIKTAEVYKKSIVMKQLSDKLLDCLNEEIL